MLDIKADSNFFSVNKNSSYMNGQPGIDVYIGPGYELTQMREKVNQTFDAVELLKKVIIELQEEAKLREQYPALKEAWDHYKMIHALVKDHNTVDK